MKALLTLALLTLSFTSTAASVLVPKEGPVTYDIGNGEIERVYEVHELTTVTIKREGREDLTAVVPKGTIVVREDSTATVTVEE